MPQLGETVTEGTITRWLKAVGDAVAEDEVLFEVSTDKVDSEVPSPAGGVLAEILVGEGDTVDVGTRLAVISDGAAAPAATDGGEAAPAAADPVAPVEQPAPAEPTPAGPAPASASAEPAPDERAATSASAEPVPDEPAATEADEVEATEPVPVAAAAVSGSAGAPTATPSRAPATEAVPAGDSGKVLSPVVRRLIAEHKLDPATIQGSGAGGRITRSDVLALIDRQSTNGRANGSAPAPGAPPAPATPAPPAGAPTAVGPAPAAAGRAPGAEPFAPSVAGERDTVVPFTNIRRRTAEHMVRSKATSAHTMVAVEVDYLGVDEVRNAVKASFKEAEGFSLTYLPFIARAVVDVLRDFPHVNSSVGEDALIVHNQINLGIAVDLDFEGLLVPVVHDADGKRLRQIAREISGLATKAKGRKLNMDDISGGTFTLTNAGPFGTLITVPVINQPQVGILSTDGVKKRPVVVELPDGTDAIAIHPVGNLALSWDHRAFDGAYAAAFLAAVKRAIETREWAAEL